MNQRVVNPNEGIYPATPDYIHALEVTGATRQLYVSGSMGLAPDGSAPESLDAQLDLVWSNINLWITISTEKDTLCQNIPCWDNR